MKEVITFAGTINRCDTSPEEITPDEAKTFLEARNAEGHVKIVRESYSDFSYGLFAPRPEYSVWLRLGVSEEFFKKVEAGVTLDDLIRNLQEYKNGIADARG